MGVADRWWGENWAREGDEDRRRDEKGNCASDALVACSADGAIGESGKTKKRRGRMLPVIRANVCCS